MRTLFNCVCGCVFVLLAVRLFALHFEIWNPQIFGVRSGGSQILDRNCYCEDLTINSHYKNTRKQVVELLEFTATWCGPCRQMRPIIERLRQEGYNISQVDFDENRAFAARHSVKAVPTFIMFRDGKDVGRHVGVASAIQLRNLYGEK